MEQNNFNEIFNCIGEHLPNNWKKLALYFLFSGNMTSRKFYVDNGQGYVDCCNMGYEKTILRQIFYQIEDILYDERNKLPKKDQWSVFTMFVKKSGEFDVKYEYGDFGETFVEHQTNWEKENIYKK